MKTSIFFGKPALGHPIAVAAILLFAPPQSNSQETPSRPHIDTSSIMDAVWDGACEGTKTRLRDIRQDAGDAFSVLIRGEDAVEYIDSLPYKEAVAVQINKDTKLPRGTRKHSLACIKEIIDSGIYAPTSKTLDWPIKDKLFRLCRQAKAETQTGPESYWRKRPGNTY
jgi:hypothetical protein